MSLTAPEGAAAILTFDTVSPGGLYLQAVYNAAVIMAPAALYTAWFN